MVAHGGVLYIGGIIAEDTSLDMAGQTDDVLRQLAKLLAAGGSSIARAAGHDLSEKPDINRVWKAHFKEVSLPARAMIGVADQETGVKLELVATAGSGWVGGSSGVSSCGHCHRGTPVAPNESRECRECENG